MAMARRPPLEDRLTQLAALRHESDTAVVQRELGKCLRDRSHHLVGKAAALTAELELEDLADALTDAFDRFMVDPTRTDKGCVAKTAIARALVDLEVRAAEELLCGVRHRQPEPAWGGPVDTAVPLRAACAEGLLVARHPDLILELTELLVDPETNARLAAVRVLAASGRPEAEPLLRLKAHLGDRENEVTSEVLTGLLAITPRRSLTFVETFLGGEDSAVVEAAAMALGTSRLEEAVPVLKKRYADCREYRLRQTLLIAVSMLRREPGFDFLLSLVSEANADRATHALVALALHREDATLREQVESALASRRDDHDLDSVFAREFN